MMIAVNAQRIFYFRISQGSVVTHLRWGGEWAGRPYHKT